MQKKQNREWCWEPTEAKTVEKSKAEPAED